MLEFAAWVESTQISKTLFGMSWLWPACESLHFIGLCLLIGGAGLLDLRLMGMGQRIERYSRMRVVKHSSTDTLARGVRFDRRSPEGQGFGLRSRQGDA